MTLPSPLPGTRPLRGLHHVTAMAQDPQRNIDFYSQTLGQRLVKVTVNFDDPGTLHLYYGDRTGQPGTVMTHFPWPGAKRGVRGNGEVVATAYLAPHGSEGYWEARLREHGFAPTWSERFGQPVLTVEDPDGTWVELVFGEGGEAQRWPGSPVPAEHELRGFHSVTAWVQDAQTVRELLVGHLGFAEEGSEPGTEGTRTRFRAAGDGAGQSAGQSVDVVERPGQPRGRFGTGSIHHVALRLRDDAEQEAFRRSLSAAGYRPTPVQDRQYFRSVYFRERGGVLFELATDGPGFTADEGMEELGRHLRLPAQFEGQRASIEAHLPRIVNREYGTALGSSPTAGIPETPPSEASGNPVSRDLGAAAPTSAPEAEVEVYTAGRPPSEARVAAVLLHGRGGTAPGILSLADELSLSAYAYLAPQAPGNSWYPRSFLAPVEQNQPSLDRALATVDAVLTELERRGIPPQRVVLGGFSQGACLALEYASRAGRPLGGVFALSGGLITLDRGGDLAGLPVFMGVAPDDAHIPLSRFQESAEHLRSRGAVVDDRVYPGLGHSVNGDELNAVRALLERVERR